MDITSDRIRAYVRIRREDGYANGTIRKDLAALRRAFNLAVQSGLLSSTPHFPTVRANNVRGHFLTMGDVDAVASQIGPDLGPVVRFAAMTGWRKREALGLRWSQVDFEAGELRLEGSRSKNSEARTFPFAALPELDDLPRQQRRMTDAFERGAGQIVPWVFHRNGQEIRSMRKAWNGAAKRAGVPDAWFHDLRRTAVRNLERAGVSRSVAMKLTGHKTESVYRRYAIADSAALAEGVSKVARLYAKGGDGRSVIPLRGTNAAQSGS